MWGSRSRRFQTFTPRRFRTLPSYHHFPTWLALELHGTGRIHRGDGGVHPLSVAGGKVLDLARPSIGGRGPKSKPRSWFGNCAVWEHGFGLGVACDRTIEPTHKDRLLKEGPLPDGTQAFF